MLDGAVSRDDTRLSIDSVHIPDGTESSAEPTMSSANDLLQFSSLCDLQESVLRLQHDLEIARPTQPLSGRIIQVVYSLPFTFTSVQKREYLKRKAEADAATDLVAKLAAAARARRAEREEQERLENAAMEMQNSLQMQQIEQGRKTRSNSFVSDRQRRSSNPGLAAMRNPFLDNADMETKLWENQERSRRIAGRRAWMLTDFVDDDVSEDDRFSSVSSQNRGASSSSFEQDMPIWVPRCTGISEQSSPASLEPEPEQTSRPPWVLGLTRGHSALNSGIYSLCSSYKQTYIGAPIHFHDTYQYEIDTRTEMYETTPTERAEIEQVLASLEDRNNWKFHDGGLEMRPSALKDISEHEAGIKYVPIWLDHRAAHSHYEAYCKASKFIFIRLT